MRDAEQRLVLLVPGRGLAAQPVWLWTFSMTGRSRCHKLTLGTELLVLRDRIDALLLATRVANLVKGLGGLAAYLPACRGAGEIAPLWCHFGRGDHVDVVWLIGERLDIAAALGDESAANPPRSRRGGAGPQVNDRRTAGCSPG